MASLKSALADGLRLFYEKTDIDAATRALEDTLADVLASPCILASGTTAMSEFPEAAQTLIRLHMMKGNSDKAATLALAVLPWLREGGLRQDAPPEVLRFVDGVEATLPPPSDPLRIIIDPPELADGTTLVVDGRHISGQAPWSLQLRSGQHEIAVSTPMGLTYYRRANIPQSGKELHIDLALAAVLDNGPDGAIQLKGVPTDNAERTATRIAAASSSSVMLVRAAAELGGLDVERIGVDGSIQPWLQVRIRPEGGHIINLGIGEAQAAAPAWPWPWVAAGVSAGSLTAAILLNVAANRDARAINRGENILSRQQSERNASIACYAVSGAAAAGAIVLAILKPKPATSVIILPDRHGAIMLGIEKRL